ncbi:MAG: hypothetical protein R3A52_08255 [Polyangiales bacterium]
MKFKSELQALMRTESEYRYQIQHAFRRYPNALLKHVNNLLDAANEALGERRLLVVIDNLDRYDPEVVDKLLYGSGRLVRALKCHMIVTPPIALHYKPKTEPLDKSYIPVVLYTVRLRRKDQPHDAFDPASVAKKLLLEALDKRMDLDKLMPDPAARDRLLSASGGAMRDLLRLVREAIVIAPGAKLEHAAIDRAATRLRIDMRDRINANGWAPTLARIMRDKQINDAPDCLDLLYQQLVYRYNSEGWYDVHPLVAEIPEVQAAFKALPAPETQTKTD